MSSSSRGRERRGEYRPTVRRSRSPLPPPKRRSYSPPLKRKASPIVERELSRRPKISKSPVGSRGLSRGASDLRYNTSTAEPEPRTARNVASSERFREREYEEDREVGVPQFRGPEGSVDFDINELKKFTIEIVRKPSSGHGESSINRNILNPDDIVPVRRPGMRGGIEGQKFRSHYSNRGNFHVRGHFNNHNSPAHKWKNNQEEESYDYINQNEGLRPLFLRAETSSSKDKARNDDYQRIVAIDTSRGSGHDRAHSRERPPPRGYSPGPSHYDDNRRPYYSERERGHSPYESRHRSPHRDEYVEPRDKHRDRRGGSREDLRRDLDVRKREERRYSPERRPSFERDPRESDLRSRINEKRSDPHPRMEERERDRRYEGERERGERHGRPHHSSPPRERKRLVSPERHEGSRDRREAWERDRERDVREREGSRRRHSREREPREHSDHHYEESRRPPSSHKSDYEPKKFYKNYEAKEFIPPPVRGRGLPIRRGVPPIMRGRGMVRGMGRGFRGGVMVPRGIPRGGPFIPRGFPPRFFPPY